MNTQEKIEAIRKWVITSIHGCDYIDAWHKEKEINPTISIGRLMAAFKDTEYAVTVGQKGVIRVTDGRDYIYVPILWQLLRPDGSEATLEDQPIETIEKLLKLLKS